MTPKKKVAWTMLGSMGAWGASTALVTNPNWATASDVVGVMLTSLLIFAWYSEDARERAYRRGYWQNLGVAAVALVGVPVYFFRSRGAYRGAIAVAAAIGFYLLLLVAMIVGSLLGIALGAAFGLPPRVGLQ